MLKRGLLIMTILFFGFNSAAHASRMREVDGTAPDRVGQVDLGVNVAASFNDDADDAVFVGGQLAYGVTPYIGVGVEAGWQESDGEADGETIGAVPVLADIILRIPTIHETIVPYGVLGLGGGGVYVERDNQEDVDDTDFAWKLGGGLDWFINSNWIFNVEFAYWSIGANLPGTSVQDDFEFWTAGVGLKYVF